MRQTRARRCPPILDPEVYTLWRRGNSWTASQLRKLAENVGLTVTEIRGSVFYLRKLLAARIMARFDQRLGKVATIGAAYVAMSAMKKEN